ncbi:MAG TPA: SCP2 sterol-binding domain-containing protein [Polyangiaceae bacterium]|nr:SCP2 sterol-binding domain-containing protein [Polyangiaceae bacterium]
MTRVPAAPEDFFAEYLPARVARLSPVLGQRSSPGSVLFDVEGAGRWWLRLEAGRLVVQGDELPGHLLTIALRQADFERVIAAGAEQVGETLPPERQIIAARMLTLDAERASLVRGVGGSLALVLADAGVTRRLLIAPAGVAVDLDKPTCDVSCTLEDFWKLQSGESNAFELLMAGRIRFGGDAQIAMALSGVFA